MRGWRGDGWSGDLEEAAGVVDFSDESGVGVDARGSVEADCVVAPGGLEELVHYFYVFFCLGVAVVVLDWVSGVIWPG